MYCTCVVEVALFNDKMSVLPASLHTVGCKPSEKMQYEILLVLRQQRIAVTTLTARCCVAPSVLSSSFNVVLNLVIPSLLFLTPKQEGDGV